MTKTGKKLSFKDNLIDEYKKTINDLLSKLRRKEKQIDKYKEKLKNDRL